MKVLGSLCWVSPGQEPTVPFQNRQTAKGHNFSSVHFLPEALNIVRHRAGGQGPAKALSSQPQAAHEIKYIFSRLI